METLNKEIVGMPFIIFLFLEALMSFLLPIMYMQVHDIPAKNKLSEDMDFGMLAFFSFYLSLPIIGILSFILSYILIKYFMKLSNAKSKEPYQWGLDDCVY